MKEFFNFFKILFFNFIYLLFYLVLYLNYTFLLKYVTEWRGNFSNAYIRDVLKIGPKVIIDFYRFFYQESINRLLIYYKKFWTFCDYGLIVSTFYVSYFLHIIVDYLKKFLPDIFQSKTIFDNFNSTASAYVFVTDKKFLPRTFTTRTNPDGHTVMYMNGKPVKVPFEMGSKVDIKEQLWIDLCFNRRKSPLNLRNTLEEHYYDIYEGINDFNCFDITNLTYTYDYLIDRELRSIGDLTNTFDFNHLILNQDNWVLRLLHHQLRNYVNYDFYDIALKGRYHWDWIFDVRQEFWFYFVDFDGVVIQYETGNLESLTYTESFCYYFNKIVTVLSGNRGEYWFFDGPEPVINMADVIWINNFLSFTPIQYALQDKATFEKAYEDYLNWPVTVEVENFFDWITDDWYYPYLLNVDYEEEVLPLLPIEPLTDISLEAWLSIFVKFHEEMLIQRALEPANFIEYVIVFLGLIIKKLIEIISPFLTMLEYIWINHCPDIVEEYIESAKSLFNSYSYIFDFSVKTVAERQGGLGIIKDTKNYLDANMFRTDKTPYGFENIARDDHGIVYSQIMSVEYEYYQRFFVLNADHFRLLMNVDNYNMIAHGPELLEEMREFAVNHTYIKDQLFPFMSRTPKHNGFTIWPLIDERYDEWQNEEWVKDLFEGWWDLSWEIVNHLYHVLDSLWGIKKFDFEKSTRFVKHHADEPWAYYHDWWYEAIPQDWGNWSFYLGAKIDYHIIGPWQDFLLTHRVDTSIMAEGVFLAIFGIIWLILSYYYWVDFFHFHHMQAALHEAELYAAREHLKKKKILLLTKKPNDEANERLYDRWGYDVERYNESLKYDKAFLESLQDMIRILDKQPRAATKPTYRDYWYVTDKFKATFFDKENGTYQAPKKKNYDDDPYSFNAYKGFKDKRDDEKAENEKKVENVEEVKEDVNSIDMNYFKRQKHLFTSWEHIERFALNNELFQSPAVRFFYFLNWILNIPLHVFATGRLIFWGIKAFSTTVIYHKYVNEVADLEKDLEFTFDGFPLPTPLWDEVPVMLNKWALNFVHDILVKEYHEPTHNLGVLIEKYVDMQVRTLTWGKHLKHAMSYEEHRNSASVHTLFRVMFAVEFLHVRYPFFSYWLDSFYYQINAFVAIHLYFYRIWLRLLKAPFLDKFKSFLYTYDVYTNRKNSIFLRVFSRLRKMYFLRAIFRETSVLEEASSFGYIPFRWKQDVVAYIELLDKHGIKHDLHVSYYKGGKKKTNLEWFYDLCQQIFSPHTLGAGGFAIGVSGGIIPYSMFRYDRNLHLKRLDAYDTVPSWWMFIWIFIRNFVLRPGIVILKAPFKHVFDLDLRFISAILRLVFRYKALKYLEIHKTLGFAEVLRTILPVPVVVRVFLNYYDTKYQDIYDTEFFDESLKKKSRADLEQELQDMLNSNGYSSYNDFYPESLRQLIRNIRDVPAVRKWYFDVILASITSIPYIPDRELENWDLEWYLYEDEEFYEERSVLEFEWEFEDDDILLFADFMSKRRFGRAFTPMQATLNANNLANVYGEYNYEFYDTTEQLWGYGYTERWGKRSVPIWDGNVKLIQNMTLPVRTRFDQQKTRSNFDKYDAMFKYNQTFWNYTQQPPSYVELFGMEEWMLYQKWLLLDDYKAVRSKDWKDPLVKASRPDIDPLRLDELVPTIFDIKELSSITYEGLREYNFQNSGNKLMTHMPRWEEDCIYLLYFRVNNVYNGFFTRNFELDDVYGDENVWDNDSEREEEIDNKLQDAESTSTYAYGPFGRGIDYEPEIILDQITELEVPYFLSLWKTNRRISKNANYWYRLYRKHTNRLQDSWSTYYKRDLKIQHKLKFNQLLETEQYRDLLFNNLEPESPLTAKVLEMHRKLREVKDSKNPVKKRRTTIKDMQDVKDIPSVIGDYFRPVEKSFEQPTDQNINEYKGSQYKINDRFKEFIKENPQISEDFEKLSKHKFLERKYRNLNKISSLLIGEELFEKELKKIEEEKQDFKKQSENFLKNLEDANIRKRR